ncbi:MAG: hypothetical protein PHY27_03185 [Parabacteroides sp.]|nr:hypothetical protein [Parabacteroides sp.]
MGLFYYSTNTYLSYFISKTFYNGTFYVWCAPVFDPLSLDHLNPLCRIPPSSSPFKIYQDLKQEVNNRDLHSAKIEANRNGLKKGAINALANGLIDNDELTRINYIIDKADLTDFKPMLYLIPVSLVATRVEVVSVSERANPLSEEYKIVDLKEYEFEIIQQF